MDKSCRDAGSRWSLVFGANAIVMYAIAMNMICVGCGVCHNNCRMIGAYCALALCFIHILVLVFTAFYRFDGMGQLCSESLAKSSFVDDNWTYSTDGNLILILFVIQVFTGWLCFHHGTTDMRLMKIEIGSKTAKTPQSPKRNNSQSPKHHKNSISYSRVTDTSKTQLNQTKPASNK